MKKKEPFKIQMRKNPYILWTFGLGLLTVLMILGNIYEAHTQDQTENEKLCSVIYATPAWASNGKIVSYGVIIPQNQSLDFIGTELIPNRIKFLYQDGCSACEAQIDYFKELGEWDDYVNEG